MKQTVHKVVAGLAVVVLALAMCVGCSFAGASKASALGGQQSQGGDLVVRFIDVGQGDAALVSCDGHHLFIDGGPADQSSKVYSVLKNLGVTQLDAVIATHPDADHIGGISGALNFASTPRCYSSVAQADTKTFESLVKYLGAHNAQLQVPAAGDSFALGGAQVTFVGPVAQLEGDNNNSLVVRVDFGQTSFLFAGDAEFEQEDSLLAAGANVRATVLKVAHHGSGGSSSNAFLKRVAPDVAVISVGENGYGHPAESALRRLEGTGAIVLRTDQLGTITVVSNGSSLSTTWGKEVSAEPGAGKTPDELAAASAAALAAPGVLESSGADASQPSDASQIYVLNTGSMKFHRPNCKSVAAMTDKNKQTLEGSRDQAISLRYQPCGVCKP